MTDFLSERKQYVNLGKHVFESAQPNAASFPPLFVSLYTNSCICIHFGDDTTLTGLMLGGDESPYWWDIDHLALAIKTVEMFADFRKDATLPNPIILYDSSANTVESF